MKCRWFKPCAEQIGKGNVVKIRLPKKVVAETKREAPPSYVADLKKRLKDAAGK